MSYQLRGIIISVSLRTLRSKFGLIIYMFLFTFCNFITSNYIKSKENQFPCNIKSGYLKNDDLIFVGTSFFSNTASIKREITIPFKGFYSTYRLFELINE